MPRDLGGILSDAFALYRANFRVLVVIAAIGQIPLFIADFASSDAITATLGVASLFTGLLANAASTYVVAQRCLGRRATVTGAYVAALNNGTSLLLNALAFSGVLLGTAILSIVLVGIPLFFFLLVAWFFYTQAVMIEVKGPGAALTRSRNLVQGSWWRVFGIGVGFVLVMGACAIAASVPGLLVGLASETVGDLLVTAGGTLVSPLGYVGATLVYLDLRARKEGYTLDALARELG